MLDTGCWMLDVRRGVLDAGCSIGNAGQVGRERAQHPVASPMLASHPVSSILYRVSSIVHPASSTLKSAGAAGIINERFQPPRGPVVYRFVDDALSRRR